MPERMPTAVNDNEAYSVGELVAVYESLPEDTKGAIKRHLEIVSEEELQSLLDLAIKDDCASADTLMDIFLEFKSHTTERGVSEDGKTERVRLELIHELQQSLHNEY